MCRKTVYFAWKPFQESGTTSGKPIPGKTRTVRTKTIMSALKKKIERNQQGNVGKVTKHTGISRSSMRRIIVDVLQLTTYKKQSRQLNLEFSKQKRMDRDKLMIWGIERATSKVFI